METGPKIGVVAIAGAEHSDETDEVEMPSCPASQEEMEQGASSNQDNYNTEEGGYGEDDKTTRSCVLKMLDEMDGRVEKLRADALKVEAERDDIQTTLDTLSNSQLVHDLGGVDLDEVNRYIKRLSQRSAAVRVEISTERSAPQLESLNSVNTLIDALIRVVKSDVVMAKRRCMSYLNSCSDEADELFQRNCGIDAIFEVAVLGCTLEDQKRVKKRLHGLYSYFLTYSEGQPNPSASALSRIKEEHEGCAATLAKGS